MSDREGIAENMTRRRLTPSARAAMLARQGGCCIVDGCTETANLEEEHSTPFTWTGALPDQLMCETHHKEKTRKDIKAISKVKRIRKREAGETKTKRKIQSPGFRKDVRKKMDGSVEKKR